MNDKAIMSEGSISTISGPSLSSHWLLWGIAVFIFTFIIWANLAVLDEVTTGEGKVIPSSKIQVIQNLEGGIVGSIQVKEGNIVKKGQILMYIDDTRFASSFKEALQKTRGLQVKVARLTAEISGKPFTVDKQFKKDFPKLIANEHALYESRQNELQTRIGTLEQQVQQRQHELSELLAKMNQLAGSHALVRKELLLTKPLLHSGAVSEVEVLRLERQVNDIAGELKATELAIPRLKSSIAEAKNAVKEIKVGAKTKALSELNDTKAELNPLSENIKALEDRVKRTAVRSPVRGTVKQIHVATIGGVVQPGSDLMEIVPLDDTLLLEAHIRPSDIGFLHPGQDAIVKITAYDFAIYGGLCKHVFIIKGSGATL